MKFKDYISYLLDLVCPWDPDLLSLSKVVWVGDIICLHILIAQKRKTMAELSIKNGSLK
jgi:hypothetical protein